MDIKIKDWTFTHWWVRPVVNFWFKIYHKSITYSGLDRIDWQKPIIFAPSHQNAFSDALCIILPTRYTENRFIYPLIRADAFGQNAAIDWILTAFHMMPVYRPRDKVRLKKRNATVFSDCHDVLAKKRNLLIHPEGNSIPKKRVSRFKKGLARIALGGEEKHNFNLGMTVVPVGINYREITAERQGIHIRFGEAVSVSDFRDDYTEHRATAITKLTRTIEERVKELTVDIPGSYELTENLLRLAKSYNPEIKLAEYTGREFELEKKLIKNLSKQSERDLEIINSLYDDVKTLLNKNKLKAELPLTEEYSAGRTILEGAAYLALLPVFLYGWINSLIPWMLSHKIADKIGEKQFESSARMVASLLIFPVCYLLQSAVFGWISGDLIWTLAYLASLPITGLLSLNIWEKWQKWRQQVRLKLMPADHKSQLSTLMDKILGKINNPSAETLSDPA